MKRYYTIDHKWLFLFGFVFYLIIPWIAGISEAFDGFPGMQLYHGFFRQVPSSKIAIYLIIIFSWLFAFYAGHYCFRLTGAVKKELSHFPINSADYGIAPTSLALCVVLLLFTWLARNSLFSGYASYDVAARGKMSTLLVIFNFFILYQLVGKKTVSVFTVTGTVLTCILLLSMGGRLYVFQTLIIILIYKTSFAKKRWKIFQVLGMAVIAFLLGSISGLWRMGTGFNLGKAFYSFFAEPIFTWISASTFLSANDIPWVNIPMNFLTSFLNMIPNSFISLHTYIVSGQAMGYSYQSPLGADSVWTTYIINFGIIGSFIFVFLTGFILNMLKYYSMGSRFGTVYYIMVCGMLPFQFFRDGFYIINKQLFFNFLLLPALVLFMLKLINYFNRLPLNEYLPGKKWVAEKIN